MTKQDALQLAGHKMMETGLVSEEYLPGIMARETLASTFLDHGIAVPHGMPESRHAIKKTGVVVIQFPEGVEWGNDHQVFLAFGIAAHCNEHLKILSGLTRVLDNRPLCSVLARTLEADLIVHALEGKAVPGLGGHSTHQSQCQRKTCDRGWVTTSARESPESRELFREFLVRNTNGLHARCGSAFIAAMNDFETRVEVRNVTKNGEYVNGRSLVKLLSLELVSGEVLGVRLSGSQLKSALKRLELFQAEELNNI